MPTTDTPKPVYSAMKPPGPFIVFTMQSPRPEKLFFPEPTSEAKRVRA